MGWLRICIYYAGKPRQLHIIPRAGDVLGISTIIIYAGWGCKEHNSARMRNEGYGLISVCLYAEQAHVSTLALRTFEAPEVAIRGV